LSNHLDILQIPPFSTSAPAAGPLPPGEGIRAGGTDGNGGVEGVYYKRANGSWDHLDFGTTATCCMVLNAREVD